jgi:hypothetical protein
MHSRTVVPNAALLALTLLSGAAPPAIAQAPNAVPPAPVPPQITSARRVFVSNAGSDSYGPEVYYHLTKYDGGPDRLYHSFYAALTQWGRLELVAEPARADVVYAVRFASPVVAKRDSIDLVYDPQINVTIVDPRTQITLWSALAPVGAARQFELQQRRKHAGWGALLGFTVTSVIQVSQLRYACDPTTPGAPCTPQSRIAGALLQHLAGASAGALIGWSLPVRTP